MRSKLKRPFHTKTHHSTKIFLGTSQISSQLVKFVLFFSYLLFRKQVRNFHYIYYLFLGTKVASTSWTTWPGIEFSSHKSYKHYKKGPFNCNLKIMVWVNHTNHSTCSLRSFQPKKKKCWSKIKAGCVYFHCFFSFFLSENV